MMSFDNPFNQGEPQANPRCLRSFPMLSAVEWLEDVWQVDGRNARPFVLDGDLQSLPPLFVYLLCPDCHPAAVPGIFDGILNQVLQASFHQAGVHLNQREAGTRWTSVSIPASRKALSQPANESLTICSAQTGVTLPSGLVDCIRAKASVSSIIFESSTA